MNAREMTAQEHRQTALELTISMPLIENLLLASVYRLRKSSMVLLPIS